MLGLDYQSSDEEEVTTPVEVKTDAPNAKPSETATSAKNNHEALPAAAPAAPTATPPAAEPLAPAQGPVLGPAAGPSIPPSEAGLIPNASGSAPQSPYSSARAAIRNLTLPPIPNFDIPPSPPGSPPPGPTAKMERFLELKKQGVHFNKKLEESSALRNPSLLKKLRDFAGISDEDQYAMTLPEVVAVPTKFPHWAYADELAKTQEKVLKRKEEEQAKKQREAIEFVPATASGDSSRSGTPGAVRSKFASGAERVMAGLDRDRRSPAVQDSGRRRDGERRGDRYEGSRSRFRSRSRSPRRRY